MRHPCVYDECVVDTPIGCFFVSPSILSVWLLIFQQKMGVFRLCLQKSTLTRLRKANSSILSAIQTIYNAIMSHRSLRNFSAKLLSLSMLAMMQSSCSESAPETPSTSKSTDPETSITPAAPPDSALSPSPPILSNLSELDPAASSLVSEKYKEAVEHPENAGARGELAKAYHANAVYEAAQESYEQALQLDPERADFWYLLSWVHNYLGAHEEAMASINRCIETNSSYTPAHARKGFSLMAQGKFDEATASFERALRIDPDYINGHLGLARIQIQKNKADQALETLERLTREKPEDLHIQYMLGTAYRQLGEREKAQPLLAAGAGSPLSWKGLDPWLSQMQGLEAGYRTQHNRAHEYLAAGRPKDAISILEKLLEQNPQDIAVLVSLSGAYTALGDLDAVEKCLSQAYLINPQHFAVLLNLGSLYLRKNELVSALSFTREAVRINPTLATAHFQLGQVLFQQGILFDAVTSLRTAIEYNANHKRAHQLLIVSLNRLRSPDDTIKAIRRMIIQFPGDPEGYFMISKIYISLKQFDNARSVIEDASRRFPDDPRLTQITSDLEKALAAPP